MNKQEQYEWMLKCKQIVDEIFKKNVKSNKDLQSLIDDVFTDEEKNELGRQFILKLTNDYADKLMENKNNTQVMYG
jgi:hypothetical protein